MDNLNAPAAPFVNYLMSSYEDCDNQYGFTKLEKAALVIAQGMCSSGDWLQEAGHSQYKHIAEVAMGIAKSVLEECNK